MLAKRSAQRRPVLAASEFRARLRVLAKWAKNHIRTLLARVNRRRSRAKFIAVTGSSGKTTTVQLLGHILAANFKVRVQSDRNSFEDATKTLRSLAHDDQFVVMELATGGPGQLDRVTKLVKPDISIVTLVAIEHYTAFRSIEAVAEEKGTLVRGLSASGLAILNGDDGNVRAMQSATTARSVLFGIMEADYQATDIETSPAGALTLTLQHGGKSFHVQSQLLGAHHWLAVSAAATCALELGVSPETIATRVATFAPIDGRMSVHRIAGGPTFILDTLKAPFHSIELPLATLKAMRAPRKRFILGQISDYAGNSTPKYRNTYVAAREVADEVIFVGEYRYKSRTTKEDVEQGRFRAFETVERLSHYLKETALDGEIIMVKSSKHLHLERLMLDWTKGVRCWPNACGIKTSCFECGLYRLPFAEHGGARKARKTRPALCHSTVSAPG